VRKAVLVRHCSCSRIFWDNTSAIVANIWTSTTRISCHSLFPRRTPSWWSCDATAPKLQVSHNGKSAGSSGALVLWEELQYCHCRCSYIVADAVLTAVIQVHVYKPLSDSEHYYGALTSREKGLEKVVEHGTADSAQETSWICHMRGMCLSARPLIRRTVADMNRADHNIESRAPSATPSKAIQAVKRLPNYAATRNGSLLQLDRPKQRVRRRHLASGTSTAWTSITRRSLG